MSADPWITLPEMEDALPDAATEKGLLSWLSAVDHKQIGILYLLAALAFFLLGGGLALMMRIQLVIADNHLLGPEIYNQFFTVHGTTMIFFVLTPVFLGFAVYLVPLMIGANEMAYPRLNAYSFWVMLFGGFLLFFSFLTDGAPDAGWFSYAPLSESNYATQGIDYYCMGLLLAGTGTLGTAINLIVTILKYRVPGMGLKQMPLFVWMMLFTAFLIVGAIPPLNAALSMLLLDRTLHAHFFTPLTGGAPVLWQHLFWMFGHPEVYILVLPAFGIFSEVFQVFSRKPIFGYGFMVASGIAIALLSFGVWVHHMFATGLGNTVNGFFAASSLLIGVPTGIKIFNWLGTMYKGSIRLTVSMLFAIAFLIEFTIGGLSGIAFAIVPIDWQTTDSYFVVAHLHYVFVGGSLFGVFSGLFYWFPKITGRMMSERAGRLFFWLFVIGFNLTFFIQHILGMMGMPRRVYTYPDLPYYTLFNALSTAGALLMGLAVVVLLWIIFHALKHGRRSGNDPWDAFTLEWYADAPPKKRNFKLVPPVRSTRPFFDMKYPEHADWKNE